jgi:thioredoxin 1
MKFSALAISTGFVCLFLTAALASGENDPQDFSLVPEKGVVTMVDLGAKACIPCKMMAPVLDKLETVYAGRAAITFIDVRKHREQAKRFRIRAIPTQIFFGKDGVEVYRHVGFLGEQEIIAQLKKMGVDPPKQQP